MNLNNFTLKSQEAIQQAQQIAVGNGNPSIESGHILKGILEVDQNVTPFLFKKLNINIPIFTQALDKIVGRYPKTDNNTGQYLSNEAQQALAKAANYIKEFKDEYVSIEHLLLGILATKDTVSQLMKDNGTHEGCIEQIYRLFKDNLYSVQDGNVDAQGQIRIDDLEMRKDIQQTIAELWQKVNTENLEKLTDINGYRHEFYRLFGFNADDVDYNADVDPNVKIESIV